MIQRVIIDVGPPRRRRAPADAARPAPLHPLRRPGLPRRVGRRAVEPGRRDARVRVDVARSQAASSCASPTPRPARCATCSRRTVATFFESGNGRVNWRYLPASNEVIWFSERDNWGQLYLYDLKTGTAEEPDHDRRGERHAAAARRREEPRALLPRRRAANRGATRTSAISTASASTASNLTLLTPEDAEPRRDAVARRAATSSTRYSKPDVPPIAVLRDARRASW